MLDPAPPLALIAGLASRSPVIGAVRIANTNTASRSSTTASMAIIAVYLGLWPPVAPLIALLIFSLLSLFARPRYEHNFGALWESAHRESYVATHVSLGGSGIRTPKYFYLEIPRRSEDEKLRRGRSPGRSEWPRSGSLPRACGRWNRCASRRCGGSGRALWRLGRWSYR